MDFGEGCWLLVVLVLVLVMPAWLLLVAGHFCGLLAMLAAIAPARARGDRSASKLVPGVF